MKTYNYTEDSQNLSMILNNALEEDVVIKRKDGTKFKIAYINDNTGTSPLDVQGVNTRITTQEIIDILRDSRESR
jgi:hypothetical protein